MNFQKVFHCDYRTNYCQITASHVLISPTRHQEVMLEACDTAIHSRKNYKGSLISILCHELLNQYQFQVNQNCPGGEGEDLSSIPG